MRRIPLERALGPARRKTAGFLGSLSRAGRVVVYCHFDADGLAAGALFGRTLPRLGFGDVRVEPAGRAESAFSEAARNRLRALRPRALVVADMGVARAGVLRRTPTLYVDHHRPEGVPPGAVVVSAYAWRPTPSAAWLAYELLSPLAAIGDLGWIAAVGAIGDYGGRAPWGELPAILARFGARRLREAVSLINAARRAPAFDVATPLRILLEADHPRALAEDDARGAGRLRRYREEVAAELERARRRPPVFSRTRPFALITFSSPCQIHPLVAESWRHRLRDRAVIAANTGYLPDRVAFSVRTAREDLDLTEELRATGVTDAAGRFARGHARASGGHLTPRDFDRLLAALGFDESARGAGGRGAGGGIEPPSRE